MPFKIVRNDITKMNTDAIVNPANPLPAVGDGVDRAVYTAAGMEQMLKERRKIGYMAVGSAFISKGYGLPCRYVIHASGPVWVDGSHDEKKELERTYTAALKVAGRRRLKSVAFPLLGAGSYGFPTEVAVDAAISSISRFLLTSDMEVTLVIFGSQALRHVGGLFDRIDSYIDDNYVKAKRAEEYLGHTAVYSDAAPNYGRADDFSAAPNYGRADDFSAAPNYGRADDFSAAPNYGSEDDFSEARPGWAARWRRIRELRRREKAEQLASMDAASDEYSEDYSAFFMPEEPSSHLFRPDDACIVESSGDVAGTAELCLEAAGDVTDAAESSFEDAGDALVAAESSLEAAGYATEAAESSLEAAGDVTEAAESSPEAGGDVTEAAGVTHAASSRPSAEIRPGAQRAEGRDASLPPGYFRPQSAKTGSGPHFQQSGSYSNAMAPGAAPISHAYGPSEAPSSGRPARQSSILPGFRKGRKLDSLMEEVGETFQEKLFRLIDEEGLKDAEVYRRANLDRKLFSKIRSRRDYQPSKKTVMALCIALRLNIDQATDLMARAGFAFSPGSRFDIIVKFYIVNGIYEINSINLTLFEYGEDCLGA